MKKLIVGIICFGMLAFVPLAKASPADDCEGTIGQIECFLDDFDPTKFLCVGTFSVSGTSTAIALYDGSKGGESSGVVGIMVADGGSGALSGSHSSYTVIGGSTSTEDCGGEHTSTEAGDVYGYWVGWMVTAITDLIDDQTLLGQILEIVCGGPCEH